jgi:hypothetical protein
LVTDIERASFLARADFAKMVAEGTAKEGSSTSILFMDKLAVEAEGADRHLLTIGANPAGTAMHVLPARIRHGRELELRSAGASVVFQPAARASVAVDAQSLRVDVSEAALAELIGALRPERGRRALRTLPLTIEVVPTEITDNAGKVVRVIG